MRSLLRHAMWLTGAAVLILLLLGVLQVSNDYFGKGHPTYANYSKVQLGMSLEDAERLLGRSYDSFHPWGEHWSVIYGIPAQDGELQFGVVVDRIEFGRRKVIGKWMRRLHKDPSWTDAEGNVRYVQTILHHEGARHSNWPQ